MSRTALLGLLLLALGIAVFVRCSSRAERRVLSEPVPEPGPASPGQEAQALSSPVPLAEATETRAPSPAEPATEVPALVGPLGVSVRVTDPDGKPLADARVSLFADEQEGTALFAGQTGADGMCPVPAPEQRRLFARIERDGLGHKHAWLDGTGPLEVELPRVVRLAGSVRNAVTHAPVAGAVIQWHLPRDLGCQECSPEPVVSDERGNFAIAELGQSSEPVHFWVEAEGYPKQGEVFTTAGEALVPEHDFELHPGLEIAGVVVDHATGAPLGGASIRASGGWATSDEAGRFRLLAVGTGTTSLSCELEGYCGLHVPVLLEAPEPVRFAMVRSTSIAGRTRDAKGRGLAGVKVFAWAKPDERAALPPELDLPPEWRWYSSSERREAVSDAEGGFTVAGLLPFQAQFWVFASCTGFRPTSTTVSTGAPGETGACELVLEPESSSGTIHGRLTLNGEPARATVHWKGPTREGYAWTRDGEYRLEHVEPGPVALSVRLDGGRALRDPHSGREAEVEVTPGSVVEHDFALTLAMAEISGSVRFEDGTPAKGLGVQFLAGGGESMTTTGEDGLYAYEVPLQDKGYVLMVHFGGQASIKRGVAAGTSGVDFVLPLFTELRYRAIEARTGLSVPHPWTHWRRSGEPYFHWLGEPALVPDASGWLRAPVPLGPIELLASTDHHHWSFASVVVGPDTEHVFELEPGHTLVFELDPASGSWPVDHALVVVEPEAAPSLAGQVSPDGQCRWTYGDRFAPGTLEWRRLDFGANARVTLNGLVGRQLLLVFPDDLVLEPAAIEVDGARPEPVSVRWRRK